MMSKTLDLGCGPNPRNPFNADEIFGVDIQEIKGKNFFKLDLAIDPLSFKDNFLDYVTAFDFLEHIPRLIYIPHRKYPFVDLMSEIYRVLKPGGKFLSYTPAFPSAQAFRDPTHKNIITFETLSLYFDNKNCMAKAYGFIGGFEIEKQEWNVKHWWKKKTHITSILVKPMN